MGLKEKKKIQIDDETLSILEMLEEGILSPVTSLMDEKSALEVMQSGEFEGVSFPSPLLFSPSGESNQKIITNLKKGDEVDLYVGNENVGKLQAESIFAIDPNERARKIVGEDLGHLEYLRVFQRLGECAVSGKVEIHNRGNIARNKNLIKQKINELNAHKICGVMLNANPIHMVHEKILQEALLKHDLLIIFVPKHNDWLLPFPLRLKSLEYVVEHFLPSQKILIIPLDYTYLLAGQNRMILNALICQNYGCTDFIASLGSSDLSIFVEGDRTHTIVDRIKGLDLSIQLLSEYVYCRQCNTIKSTKICPHGKHHHIHYDSKNFFEMLRLGLMPPEIFMRKEISAMILTHLFPSRVKALGKFYLDLVSYGGIVQDNEERFYESLSGLYHVK